MISIEGLDKAEVLAGLYNNSEPQGMSFLHFTPEAMTREQASELLKGDCDFDYIQGRVMKVNLKSDSEFSPRLYDRDNGNGAAQRVIDEIRGRQNIHAPLGVEAGGGTKHRI